MRNAAFVAACLAAAGCSLPNADEHYLKAFKEIGKDCLTIGGHEVKRTSLTIVTCDKYNVGETGVERLAVYKIITPDDPEDTKITWKRLRLLTVKPDVPRE